MTNISMDFSFLNKYISAAELNTQKQKYAGLYQDILNSENSDENEVLGWMRLDEIANEKIIADIEEKAQEIRDRADVFILIGVGGSNQGAAAALKALQKDGPEIIYAGNNLSPGYLKDIMNKIKNKSVYVNVIAKNFATLEPGICFRVIRQYMEETYGLEESARRTIAIGSPGGSSLENLAKAKGYTFFPFPISVGGRFSVLSPVGLFPIAVGGLDIRALIEGAKAIKKQLSEQEAFTSDAYTYAIVRNMLYDRGYAIELLAYFEPSLDRFGKWWSQLFGESEGKDGKSLFPAVVSYSEDLHSLGQLIQSGKRNIIETFMNIEKPTDSLVVQKDDSEDFFDYLDGIDFNKINKTAFESTMRAHTEGDVPCMKLNVPELSEYYLGQVFYFYEMVCYVSASVLGVNPFDQPGVEAYKNIMFDTLKSK